jgi:hypothetical protein
MLIDEPGVVRIRLGRKKTQPFRCDGGEGGIRRLI